MADFDGDGIPDRDNPALDGQLGPFTFTDGGIHSLMTVSVSDGEDEDSDQRNVEIPPIPEHVAREMRFSLDIGGDGSFEIANSARSSIEFMAPRGAGEVRMTGLVSGNGFNVPFDAGLVTLPNAAPSIQSVRIADQDGYDVVVVISAFDTDNDPISYAINWGDGTPTQPINAVVATHSFPRGRYGTYPVTITVSDTRGGQDVHTLDVTIEEPRVVKADVNSLTWRKVTPTEGRYDGVRSLAITPAGRVFTHSYLDEVRRLRDDGQTWDTVLDDVTCCGAMTTRGPGEVIVASPDGLYYSNDDGTTWALWAEQKFSNVTVSPSTVISSSRQRRVRSIGMTSPVVWPIDMKRRARSMTSTPVRRVTEPLSQHPVDNFWSMMTLTWPPMDGASPRLDSAKAPVEAA